MTNDTQARPAGIRGRRFQEIVIPGAGNGPEPGESGTPARRPGKLTGSFTVTFESRDAIILLRGRRGTAGLPRIYSLGDFANRLYAAWMAAAGGDPFADYQLVQTEALLKEGDRELRRMAGELKRMLKQGNTSYAFGSGQQGIRLARPSSVAPMHFEFRFGQYGSLAVRLLKQADDIFLMIRSLRYMAFMSDDAAHRFVEDVYRIMRRVLSHGSAWRHTGVTRQDLLSKNQAARGAVEKLVQSGFLDMEMYRNVEEACEVFAEYAEPTEYGPRSADQPEPAPHAVQNEDAAGEAPEADAPADGGSVVPEPDRN